MKNCSWCNNEFITAISYQIYCSVECRDQATKEKIAARYNVVRRQRRKGKERKCKSCNNSLSIYNDEVLCNFCQVNPKDVNKALKNIKDIINDKE